MSPVIGTIIAACTLSAAEPRADTTPNTHPPPPNAPRFSIPLPGMSPILFVVRHQYHKDHHNTATFFPAEQHEFNNGKFTGGGALKVLDLKDGSTRSLIELPEGVARDPDVHFDGSRIVFSMRKNAADSYHIYEIRADGSGLRQLTSATGVDDIDPIYLPDGDIIFSSTREPKYCACNRHIMANLYRMGADGANIHQIGKSTLFEGQAALMPDGRILYNRWEYVDRNFGDAQGLWTCSPDGTSHAIYWGNNTPVPGAVLDGRIIPGTQRTICTFGSCHDRPWGALAIIDRRLGLDGRAPVIRTWPPAAADSVRDPGTAKNAWDVFMRLPIKYEDPFPLANPDGSGAGKYFLCARQTGKGEETGIYLIDIDGGETLVHFEPPGCFDPMPLMARRPPPAIPRRRDFENGLAYCYIQDVYLGTHMTGVARGNVKSLRVIESPEKRFWTVPAWNGQGNESPAMNWHDFGTKQILGTVPVEPDGSVSLMIPSDRFVFFQLLDERGMMVQSMRSGVSAHSGERVSCIGCHDARLQSPPVTGALPLALRRPPHRLSGWHGLDRPISFFQDVQPIIDRHCAECHQTGAKAADKLRLSGGRGLVFNIAYAELWKKGLTGAVGAGPAEILPPYSWGSHASRLAKRLLDGHGGLLKDPIGLETILTWLDLNAPYYPSFATAYPSNMFGRSPIADAQIKRLKELTGFNPNDPTLVDFDRPEQSPCLASIPDKSSQNHAEALAIIMAGKSNLKSNPDAGADGFSKCDIDQWRERKYMQRRETELANRRAIKNGERLYDHSFD